MTGGNAIGCTGASWSRVSAVGREGRLPCFRNDGSGADPDLHVTVAQRGHLLESCVRGTNPRGQCPWRVALVQVDIGRARVPGVEEQHADFAALLSCAPQNPRYGVVERVAQLGHPVEPDMPGRTIDHAVPLGARDHPPSAVRAHDVRGTHDAVEVSDDSAQQVDDSASVGAQRDGQHVLFHDLRHTCATLLLLGGVSPRVVMEILGHSQIAVTMNTYGHVLPAMQDEAAGRMDDALGGTGEPDAR